MQLIETGPDRPASTHAEPSPAPAVTRHARHAVRSGKRHHYDLVSSPVLGTGIWLGGGLLLFLLVLVVVAVSLRH